ncbi:DMT family transporter [Candidatus Woesearchaeota archaeon]|nr:DMT family transporter [Candidatus Woesearchaeota archaeon]
MAAGVLFGIGAALGWGAADFLAARAIKNSDSLKTAFWTQLISFLMMLLLVPFFPKFVIFPWKALLLIAVATVFSVAAFLFFYRGLSVGEISVIAPVSYTYPVLPVIIVTLFFGEHLNLVQLGGIAVTVIGTVLVSFKYSELHAKKNRALAKGIEFALLAMVLWGIHVVFLDQIILHYDWYFSLLYVRLFMAVFLFAYSALSRNSLKISGNFRIAHIFLLVGFLEFAAFVFFGWGISLDLTSIVAPVAAAAPAITVGLAKIINKERLEFNQDTGVLLILIGLVVLAL